MSEFEVWCNHCDVTFPVKTRRCLHCGGRTSSERLHRSMREVHALGLPETSQAILATEPGSFEQVIADGPAETFDEEPAGRRSLLRAGMSVIWMILLAAGYLWKSCTG